jgi:hypothetical protein
MHFAGNSLPMLNILDISVKKLSVETVTAIDLPLVGSMSLHISPDTTNITVSKCPMLQELRINAKELPDMQLLQLAAISEFSLSADWVDGVSGITLTDRPKLMTCRCHLDATHKEIWETQLFQKLSFHDARSLQLTWRAEPDS